MTTNLTILLFSFFLLALLLALTKSRYVEGRAIFLMRALFPSWRFFEEITDIPKLFYRIENSPGQYDPWKPCLWRPTRSLSALLLNAEGNLMFAFGGVVQHLMQDLESVAPEDLEEFMKSPSYQLSKNIALHHLRQDYDSSTVRNFQFKICTVLQGEDDSALEDVFISATHMVHL